MRLRLSASRTGAQTPVGAARAVVTVIPERRFDTDFIFLFVAALFLAAALRGFGNAPVVSVVLFAIAAAALGSWIYIRMKPRFLLTIGPDEIVWGRQNDERRAVIARAETGWVRIEQQTGVDPWFLIARDGDEEVEKLSLFGFNLAAVADACEAHGWPVSMMGRAGLSDEGGA